jgi:lysyl-tRNA synthetase class 2
MCNSNPLVQDRIRKIQDLKSLGIDPYPVAAYSPTHSLPQVVSAAELRISKPEPIRAAGRVIAIRDKGKAIFMDILDEGQKLQLYFRRSNLDQRTWDALDLIDLGDFIGVSGLVFHTRTGELTVNGDEMMVLCKASHPIPLSKRCAGQHFNVISDKGVLYRHRHVDLLVNLDSRNVFLKRSQIIRGIRRYLDDEGFVEVETPILGVHYSGAAAKPFVTKINALDQQMYLRISPECALKRLLCGGFNKVYELGKNFRNEGIDAKHNPEFTMVEWYESYSDYLDQMRRFETLVARLSVDVNGTTRIWYRGRPLDLTPPWRRMPMLQGLRDVAGIDMANVAVDGLSELFRRRHPAGAAGEPDPLTWGTAVVALFEALVEPHLWDPVFVMDYPVEISPLTKRHRTDPRLVERFEPMIACMEVGNAYSELNDPVEQHDRLVSQQVARDQTYDLDEDFLQAMAHGMPPAGGTGLGVDRIVMILTGAESIRDVVFFPFVSRRDVQREDESIEETTRKEERS